MKVLAVKEVASGSSEKGPWTRQKIRLEKPDEPNGFVDGQLFCHKFQPVPNVGDELDVREIKQPANPAWLPEIVVQKKGGPGGGGGPRPEDPKRMASIAMQHSQDAAWRIVETALTLGLLEKTEAGRIVLRGDGLTDLQALTRTVANDVYAQVQEAQKNA